MEFNRLGACASACSISSRINVYKTIPSKLEADALHTAAGTLPPAIEVKAMADCTVAGRAHKYRMPMTKGPPSKGSNSGWAIQPNNGKSTKVKEKTTTCKRQCIMPPISDCRDRPAPDRQKRTGIR